MSNDDVLIFEDIASVRAAVFKTRRKVLRAAVVTPISAALFVWLVVYHLKFHNIAASTFIAAMFPLLGALGFVHWWRHYRSILRQLDIVAHRVANGETVYGSKVAFHSYR